MRLPLTVLSLVFPLFVGCSRNLKNPSKAAAPPGATPPATAAPEKAPADPLNPSDPVQQAMLGWKYQTGKGVVQDYSEGVKWYRKAAEQGAAIGQVSLGLCYVSGKGVDRDYSQACGWFRKAAEQGDPDGQFRLGVCYNTGAGTGKDLTVAYMWYNLAAASNNKAAAASARENQAILAKTMSQKDIAEAQRMSRVWRKK